MRMVLGSFLSLLGGAALLTDGYARSREFRLRGGYSCSTNNQNVVGCVSASFLPFYTACLDYQAFQKSACVNIGAQTGCYIILTRDNFFTTESAYGSCGTYLWTGNPPRSMYRCFSDKIIISMLDQPQFVLDALTRSTSTTSTSKTTSHLTTTGTNLPGGSTTATTNSSNLGVIVGGVVGGVAVVAAIVGGIAYLMIRRKKEKYSAVAPADPSSYSSPATGGFSSQPSSQMAMAAGGVVLSTTYPPISPYVTILYDPPKASVSGHISPRQQFNAYAPPYPPPQQHYQPQLAPMPELDSTARQQGSNVSELDSSTPPVGNHGNPAEMGVTTPR
ncbi:hypothetical protein B0H66DRAFT_530072 [Apodospora peruviana]|uniref:Uncharacterized protein n=1 Tax=Apodospora peruviana TaxID=516989 RepID=A0AAE0IJ54_9PEZI|nr:hypothetical protein B0H66DRAFT_530072 [Apodospora peruviana]